MFRGYKTKSSLLIVLLIFKCASCAKTPLTQQQQQQQQQDQPQQQLQEQQQQTHQNQSEVKIQKSISDTQIQSQQQQQQQLNFSSSTLSTQPQENLVQPSCQLGNETYQIGERWNPNLPPFGVQVCVLCECIIRHRKNCYEPKVTCRRIVNECPIIDSCPDGREPMTFPGQCCKSCPMPVSSSIVSDSAITSTENNRPNQTESEQQAQMLTTISTPTTINPRPISNDTSKVALNESTTELSIVNPTTQASLSVKITISKVDEISTTRYPRAANYHFSTTNLRNERSREYLSIIKNLPICARRDNDHSRAGGKLSTQLIPGGGKHGDDVVGSRHDHNAIDTRSAFRLIKENSLIKNRASVESGKSSLANHHNSENLKPIDHHQQHPNDYQSTSYNSARAGHSRRPPQESQRNMCSLGDELYGLNDIWHPILPPLGTQHCVVCTCDAILNSQNACYVTKVACRRVEKECPQVSSCPDGREPVTLEGQCCKSCQSSNNEYTSPRGNNYEMLSIERLKRENDGTSRDSQSIARAFPTCLEVQVKEGSVPEFNSSLRLPKLNRSTEGHNSTVKRSYPHRLHRLRMNRYRQELVPRSDSSKLK